MNSETKTNFHTHTIFCDGKNTAEEMVKAAIEKGFSTLGFSGHSMYPFSDDWHIPTKNHTAYVDEINRLKKKYEKKIDIKLGFEAEYIPNLAEPSYERFKEFKPDFLIGAVHYLINSKGFFTVDGSVDEVKNGIDLLFNGNGKKAVQEYFYLEREMVKKFDFDILAHADLIRKQNGKLNFFNEEDSWYKSEVKSLVKEIRKKDLIVEINTGAIARKTMNDVYPSEYFISLLAENKIPVMINSDAHTPENLDAAFDIAQKKAGRFNCIIKSL